MMDPAGRMTCDELLEHSYFDHFRDWFQPELEVCVCVCVCVCVGGREGSSLVPRSDILGGTWEQGWEGGVCQWVGPNYVID